MRSGTSFFMECLEASGMEVVKSKERHDFNLRFVDGQYMPNPTDLYEPDSLENISQHDGKAIKVVAPLIYGLPVYDYSVVFLRRDPVEISESLEAAFDIRQSPDRIQYLVDDALAHLRNRKDVREVIELNYPGLDFAKVPWPIDGDKCRSLFSDSQYRFRAC